MLPGLVRAVGVHPGVPLERCIGGRASEVLHTHVACRDYDNMERHAEDEAAAAGVQCAGSLRVVDASQPMKTVFEEAQRCVRVCVCVFVCVCGVCPYIPLRIGGCWH